MDDLNLMQRFRAERVKQNPSARAAARRALEARFETAAAAPTSIATPTRRQRLLPRRRRLFAFGVVTAIVAVVAGSILVLGSGPTAEPAAAEILHRTAAVAAAAGALDAVPGPGQFLYAKFKRLELKSWVPGGESMGGGVMTRPGAFTALMPTTEEWWTASDGAGRVREVAGTPRFLTSEERLRWEAAGSRLPAPFDPEYQRKYSPAFGNALEARRGVVDMEHAKAAHFRFADTSELPTEPEALRRAVETNRIAVHGFNLMYPSAKRLDPGRTVAELFNILSEGNPSPRLRAAAFGALAELPGIEVDTEAADFLGRRGNAIRSVDPETGDGSEFIFDPETSKVLAERSFLGERGRSPYLRDLPAGLTIRETAYLASGVVDSREETAAEAETAEPVATLSRLQHGKPAEHGRDEGR